MHFRAFAGYGLAFETEAKKGQVTLPFFKSYSTGGPKQYAWLADQETGHWFKYFL